MRVISLVPSWTETLLHCGFEVVGRTRYCIHPRGQVADIPIVGGTKDYNWKKIGNTKADFILVDKEENQKQILAKSPYPVHVTHIRSLRDMPQALDDLLIKTKDLCEGDQISQALQDLKKRWQQELQRPKLTPIAELPGVLKWIRKPDGEIDKLLYLIWKKPFMTVGPHTFIASVLSHLGFGNLLIPFTDSYPRITLEEYLGEKTLLLFSSEPYEFGAKKELEWMQQLKTPSALVDGEAFSWFGERSLRFLEAQNP